MPLAVWGGLLQYPVLMYLVATGQFVSALVSACACYLLFLNRHRLHGCLLIRIPDESLYSCNGDTIGPGIHLLHPHALFTEGLFVYAQMNLGHFHPVLCIDKHLYYLSPLGMVFLRMSGLESAPLIHAQIKDYLAQGRTLILSPGGFLEAAAYTRDKETLYLHMYPYWMRMAREYSCDVFTTFGYNLASRYFQQSSLLREVRTALAKRNLPGILPSGLSGTPFEEPIYMYTQQIHPHTDTLDTIRASMRKTIDKHEKTHGTRISYVIRTTV